MGYLAILIKGTKIEIKTHQNFLSRLLVLFMVYALSISGLFSAILASFGFTRVPSQLSKPSFCYATLVNLGDLCSKWQNQCTPWRLSDRSSGKRARTTQRCLLRFSVSVILSRACKLVAISWWFVAAFVSSLIDFNEGDYWCLRYRAQERARASELYNRYEIAPLLVANLKERYLEATVKCIHVSFT